ncbi:MAG: hypothetical protein K0R26_2965 [Bacteroidota bacterium]|jgi:hypothetical protein|nr:hypothetical protein [Bacteroidota bacterium]
MDCSGYSVVDFFMGGFGGGQTGLSLQSPHRSCDSEDFRLHPSRTFN